MITILGIKWAATFNVWIFILIAGIISCYFYRQYKVRRAIALLAGKWQSFVIENFLPYRQWLQLLFYSVAMICLGLAYLRPQWHKKELKIAQKGRDLLIGLDVSRSMLAQDCTPDRLAVAKKKIKTLLSKLDCERVGLLLFSGSAFVQCPFTTDYSAFYMFLDQVDAETISSGSTALDAAIGKGLELFEQAPDRKTKLMVLLTDGEDFSSNLSSLKERAKKENLHIFTIGAATQQGAPIPLYDHEGKKSGHQKDNKGNVVISKLNEGILRTLSKDAGGHYIALSQDQSDIQQLIKYIERYEKERFEDKQVNQFDDKYHYFLFAALCFFIAAWIL